MPCRSWILVLFSLCLACGGGSQTDETTADVGNESPRQGAQALDAENTPDDGVEDPGMWWYPEDDSEIYVITTPWPPSPDTAVQLVVETGMGDLEVKLIQGIDFQLSPDGVADGDWISMDRTELDEFEDRFDATVTWPAGLTCVHVRLHKSTAAAPEDLPMWVIEG